MRTLVNLNPHNEFRAMEEALERLFGSPVRPANPTGTNALPLDIIEREGKLIVRASIPGVHPNELDVQVEANVLTIRGESRHESEENEKVYRREITTGRFARSIRLPEGLDLNAVDAEFRNGVVTITLPRIVEEKPKALKVNVRTAEPALEAPAENNN
jgi:HSP20 family protein